MADYRELIAIYHRSGRFAEGDLLAAQIGYWADDLTYAHEMCRRALAAFEHLGYREGQAAAYEQFGKIAERKSDDDGATEAYGRAVAILETLDGAAIMRAPAIVQAYCNLAAIAARQHDMTKAAEMYRKGALAVETVSEYPGLAYLYGMLARIAFEQNDLSGAQEMCVKGLAAATYRDRPFDRIDLYETLAKVAQKRGDHDGEKEALGKAEALLEGLDPVASLSALERLRSEISLIGLRLRRLRQPP